MESRGPLNIKPPKCPLCGAGHEPEYPHEVTLEFRHHILREKGRVANHYDLLAHTTGAMREASMTALLKGIEVW